jgi:hypothetical protein
MCASCIASSGSPEAVGTTSEALAVSGLFATGVDASGAPLAAGSTDPHYKLSSNDLLFPGPAAIVVNAAGGWAANTATSKWISVQASTAGTTLATYTYTTTFTLSGVDPATATLSGQWACDDSCVLNLNGTQVAQNPRPAWGAVASFTVPAGSTFQLGTNTLAFATVNTTGGPTGLQVVSLSGTVSGCDNDNQCGAAQFCNTQTAACVGKLSNGTAIPTITGHTPALTGACTAPVGTAVCVAGVCDPVDSKCGYANGDGMCTAMNGATVCRSGMCSANGACKPSGGCSVDADCEAGWCNEGAQMCEGQLPNGDSIPSDPTHTSPTLNGTCTPAAATLVCQSRVCDVHDNKCGYADGDGTCTANAATVCRSGLCSVSGVCEPSGGCDADGDCPTGDWCNEAFHQCTAKLPNGAPIPNDPPHTSPTLNAACTPAAAVLVCQSGLCDTTTNDCVQCTAIDASACSGATPMCGPTDSCIASLDAGADGGGDASPVQEGGVEDGSAEDSGLADGSAVDGGEDAALDASPESGPPDSGETARDATAGSRDASEPGTPGTLEGGGLSCAVSRTGSSGSGDAPVLMLAIVLGAVVGRGRRNR